MVVLNLSRKWDPSGRKGQSTTSVLICGMEFCCLIVVEVARGVKY